MFFVPCLHHDVSQDWYGLTMEYMALKWNRYTDISTFVPECAFSLRDSDLEDDKSSTSSIRMGRRGIRWELPGGIWIKVNIDVVVGAGSSVAAVGV
ncbi:Obscurin-like protein 1 [Gossypium australe]|uniref:Obscurin-like protein 1 n=1 Tax=Gossypium australe TaxID=47621 RepID=A0A5B6WAP6_9ROSI|nr:Obscurin-like protein 1 [Gossypium australe]